MESQTDQNRNLSVYNTHAEAEVAIQQLHRSGFDMKKVSIVGRDFEVDEHFVGFYNMGERTKYWGKMGAFWGAIWGLLFGSAFFMVPGMGAIVVAGSFISAWIGVAEGAAIVGGLSALGAALLSIGVPRDSIPQYETDIKAGRFVIIVHGSKEDLKRAREVATTAGAAKINEFEVGVQS